jgi:hypothetical protein
MGLVIVDLTQQPIKKHVFLYKTYLLSVSVCADQLRVEQVVINLEEP